MRKWSWHGNQDWICQRSRNTWYSEGTTATPALPRRSAMASTCRSCVGGDQTRLCHPCVRADDQPCPSSRDAGRAWCDIAHDASGGTALRRQFQCALPTHRHPVGRTLQGRPGRYRTLRVGVLPLHRTQPVRAMMANLTPCASRLIRPSLIPAPEVHTADLVCRDAFFHSDLRGVVHEDAPVDGGLDENGGR